MSENRDRGRIEVSPAAVATIANHAVLNSYGLVGMSSKNLVNGLAQVLRADSKRGVQVHIDDDQIVIDLYVVIEYGVRVATVARNIMSQVKFSVERAMGVPITGVNVHVQGLRVSVGDKPRRGAGAARTQQSPSEDPGQASGAVSVLTGGKVP